MLTFTKIDGTKVAYRLDEIRGVEQCSLDFKSYANEKFKNANTHILLANNTKMDVTETFEEVLGLLGAPLPNGVYLELNQAKALAKAIAEKDELLERLVRVLPDMNRSLAELHNPEYNGRAVAVLVQQILYNTKNATLPPIKEPS